MAIYDETVRLKNFRLWWEKQDETHKRRFCVKHGRYTGYEGLLGCKQCLGVSVKR